MTKTGLATIDDLFDSHVQRFVLAAEEDYGGIINSPPYPKQLNVIPARRHKEVRRSTSRINHDDGTLLKPT